MPLSQKFSTYNLKSLLQNCEWSFPKMATTGDHGHPILLYCLYPKCQNYCSTQIIQATLLSCSTTNSANFDRQIIVTSHDVCFNSLLYDCHMINRWWLFFWNIICDIYMLITRQLHQTVNSLPERGEEISRYIKTR